MGAHSGLRPDIAAHSGADDPANYLTFRLASIRIWLRAMSPRLGRYGDRSGYTTCYASDRAIQLTIGIAGSTQPIPATT